MVPEKAMGIGLKPLNHNLNRNHNPQWESGRCGADEIMITIKIMIMIMIMSEGTASLKSRRFVQFGQLFG